MQENTAYRCDFCDFIGQKKNIFKRHLNGHSEYKPHICKICEKGFKLKNGLRNHLRTHIGLRPHQCVLCDKKFALVGMLVRHVRYKHTHEKPHKCSECDYASVERSKLKRHMTCHTGERPYQCPHCTYASSDNFKLKRHVLIHTGDKPYECDICHSRFNQSNSLKTHKLIHSENRPVFQCELCPATCGRQGDLRVHVKRLHTCDIPIKCKRCSQSFPDAYSYRLHLKSHKGEKCYKCELCDFASISNHGLKAHILIHTGQKPFRCEVCNESFRLTNQLKRHKTRIHNLPTVSQETSYKCPECVKIYRYKGYLIRHMTLHHPSSKMADTLKSVSPNQLAEQMDVEKQVDAAMGSPPVTILEESDNDLSAMTNPVKISVTGGVPLAVKRKRGRPRKIRPSISSAEDSESSLSRQSFDSQASSVASEGVKTSPPRKRGRPKKSASTDTPSNSVTPVIKATGGVPLAAKRKRGRPRKILPSVSSAEDSESSLSRLSFYSQSSSVASEGVKTSPPRKRNPPRKRASSDASSYSVAPVIEGEVAKTVEDMIAQRNEMLEKRKLVDIAECFGFNVAGEEEEV